MEGEYIIPVKITIEGFRFQDLTSVPQIAVPLAVPESDLRITSPTVDKNLQVVGYLITIAFYYLLWSGNYTKPWRIKQNEWLV